MFIYKLSPCGFKSHCCHLNFRYGVCFEKGVPWHSDKLECGFTLKLIHDMIITYSQNCAINHLVILQKKALSIMNFQSRNPHTSPLFTKTCLKISRWDQLRIYTIQLLLFVYYSFILFILFNLLAIFYINSLQ